LVAFAAASRSRPLISDPLFYAFAVPAVILVGLSKGGLGGAAGFIGVPLMALASSPIQAAAILLPILVLMDAVSLWSWRGRYDPLILRQTIPGSLLGIGLGWLTAAMVSPDMVRLLLGAVAIAFVGRWLISLVRRTAQVRQQPSAVKGSFWGLVSGYTSFVAHAGGPPFQVYTLPLGLDPRVFTSTGVYFFAFMNVVKLVPYFALGQFEATNLMTSAALMPLAPVATLAGAWVVRRMRAEVFYPFTYGIMAIIAVKLVWDGAAAIIP